MSRKGEAVNGPRIRVEMDAPRGSISVACSDKQRPHVKCVLAALPGGHRLADTEEAILLVAGAAGYNWKQRERVTVEVARSVRAALKLEGLR